MKIINILAILILPICFYMIGFNEGRVKPFFGDVADREYKEGYKCLQFSNDLVDKLRERGIQSEVVIGYSPDGQKHAWIAVWVEPITGEFTKGYTKGEQ